MFILNHPHKNKCLQVYCMQPSRMFLSKPTNINSKPQRWVPLLCGRAITTRWGKCYGLTGFPMGLVILWFNLLGLEFETVGEEQAEVRECGVK